MLLSEKRSSFSNYKALRIRNLQHIYRFRNKLLSFLLPVTKHTSLDKNHPYHWQPIYLASKMRKLTVPLV
jgi:hypothetical protein